MKCSIKQQRIAPSEGVMWSVCFVTQLQRTY